MQIQIDHVTVCGRDLEKMRAEFAASGITTVYGGEHANRVTHMALAGFADGSYLELIAPLPGADVSRATGMMAGWLPMMISNAGPAAWAIRTKGIAGMVEELRSHAIAVRGPEGGGRAKPDGIHLQWKTALLGPLPPGSVLPFMIEDTTDRSLRVCESQHPIGVRGVAAVVLGVKEIDEAAELLTKAFGWVPPEREDHPEWPARLARFPEGPVILAQPWAAGCWLADRVERFGEVPVAFLLSCAISPVSVTTHWFGKEISWLDEGKLGGARVALIDT
jgi:hypothetical protein